ncbi:tyrosine-type recombinase/integrase [bacterium]|nr:tyrosine-type recombinase/integrase [bacterium]
MKKFESFLTPKLEEFLRHRIALGYKDRNLRSLFLHFDRYIKENADDWYCLKPSFFLEFREKLKGEASTVNGILSWVRVFFEYLKLHGDYQYNPLQDIPPLRLNQYFPFIFSSEEVDQLLWVIKSQLPEINENNLNYTSVYIAILLMAKCGLRISEPLRILLSHYRPIEGTIYIEKTKFGSDRLIPIPKSVIAEVNRYLEVRINLPSHSKNTYLLVGSKQKALSTHQIYPIFHNAVKNIGINQEKIKLANVTFGAPNQHSLRHSFALNTLKSIKEKEKYSRDVLSILAIYMGHRNIRSTSQYLTLLDARHRQKLIDFITKHQEEI